MTNALHKKKNSDSLPEVQDYIQRLAKTHRGKQQGKTRINTGGFSRDAELVEFLLDR